jgi:RNA polymerase sigma-70 factor, ECF subfamily
MKNENYSEIISNEKFNPGNFENEAIPHREALYNYALKISGNVEDAEDLVQDTYLKAYRYFDHYNTGTNCKAWMFMIMKNSFINNYRKVQREPRMIYYDAYENFDVGRKFKVGSDNFAEDYHNQLMSDETSEAIKNLPDKMRHVLILCDIEGYSYDETAEMINIPVGTVRSRLHRARKALHKTLFDYAKKQGFLN